MTNFKNIILTIILIFIIGCGYVPLKTSKNTNFFIDELVVDGDRQLSNLITNKLKKYKKFDQDKKEIKLKILTKYEKIIANKNSSGDPQNYKLILSLNIELISNEKNKVNENFERIEYLTAQSKKLNEIEEEKSKKKDLANLISEDIIFFLINNN